MRQAKSLNRLRVCAGWPEPLVIEHTTLLEISCRGSYDETHTGLVAIENALTIDERGTKIARNSVFECHLSPVTMFLTIYDLRASIY